MNFHRSHIQNRMKELHAQIIDTYDSHGGINHIDGSNLPSQAEIVDMVQKMMQLLFPGFFGCEQVHSENLESWSQYLLDLIFQSLKKLIAQSICFVEHGNDQREHYAEAEQLALEVLEEIPEVRRMLKKDVIAAFNGDPAARTHEEIIISYPAIQAIAMHRIAHELYRRKIPLISRMISEYAHMKTGIDIHPGAQIGESFFIDHGTGVVIGETCEIGDNVKIYQMVTLGALSFRKDDDGNIIKGLKRHPTIEDNVVLYAGCTILGGETVIGKNSVIGGNVWITEPVEPGTVITFDVKKQEYQRFNKKK